jgi:hypothetical protein
MLFVPAAYAQATGGAKGKVRNPRGDGLSGVAVTARRDSTDIKTVRSGTKGDFLLSGLEPGKYNFVFDAEGYNSAIKYNVEVRSGKTVDLGDRLVMVIDRGTLVIVQGSVFSKEGKSFPGVSVIAEKIDADGNAREVANVVTNLSGEFVFRRPAGHARYRITAKYKDLVASKELEVDSAAIYRLAISLVSEK